VHHICSFYKTKTDQGGGNAKDPKHVFANAQDPLLCPLLALGILILSTSCRPVDSADSSKLFSGKSADARFGTWFRATISKLSPDQQAELNLFKERHGTHSVRKGVLTYVTGLSAGASPANINLRAGHSIGTISAKYIFQCDGADQYVGRLCAGQDHYSKAIAALPPHFHNFSTLLSDIQLSEIVAGYEQFPQCFKACVPYLLASVAFHKDSLQSILQETHGQPRHDFWNSR
jgi:hypothetical protein